MRCQAIGSLEDFGETMMHEPEMVVEVVSALGWAIQRDETASVRQEAAVSLRHFGPSQEVTALLLKALQDQNPDIRRVAAKSLGVLKSRDLAVAAALENAIKDPSVRVRLAAVTALWETTGQTVLVVPVILASILEGDALVRSDGVRLLERVRVQEASVISAVRALLGDPCRMVRILAARALWTLTNQTEKAVPVLLEALGNGSEPEKAIVQRLLERADGEVVAGTTVDTECAGTKN